MVHKFLMGNVLLINFCIGMFFLNLAKVKHCPNQNDCQMYYTRSPIRDTCSSQIPGTQESPNRLLLRNACKNVENGGTVPLPAFSVPSYFVPQRYDAPNIFLRSASLCAQDWPLGTIPLSTRRGDGVSWLTGSET